MKSKVGIIGDGNVGSALERGLKRAGYDVRAVGKDPAKVAETGAWAEIIVLAVPYPAIDATLAELGTSVAGKTLVDVTNVVGPDMQLAVGFDTSGAEQLQAKAKGAKVVKAFQTQFAAHMDSGTEKGKKLTVFAAGDDAGAKKQVLEMESAIGFDAVDAGPLRNARLLEPLGVLNIQLGYALGLGTDIGMSLVR